MAVDLPQNPLLFVMLSCVFLTTHFDNDGNEIFDDTHTIFRVLFENIFIIDEQNDGTCHFEEDANGSPNDKHVGKNVLIWNITVIDEHNDDEILR